MSLISLRERGRCAVLFAACVIASWVWTSKPTLAAAPPIRTSPDNPVPACVTPERLMAFLKARNTNLDPRFNDIAHWYQHFGEQLRVRWDYAFFQMLIETNYLTFRRGNGKRGDVHPRQNNFAGIGATGGGVPGDSFPDVPTGVRAQLEHLVVYSGEPVAEPTAPRTRLAQANILAWTVPLSKKRPVTFQDLAGKWAADKKYWRSIESIAERFRSIYCTDQQIAAVSQAKRARSLEQDVPDWSVTVQARAADIVPPPPIPAVRTAPRPAQEPALCRVLMASYGGTKTMLIRYVAEDAVEYTALQVLDGFERSMTESYMNAHAPGGTIIGEFPSSNEAFARAYELCPGADRGR